MNPSRTVRVAVNGFGVIGRVAQLARLRLVGDDG